MGGLGVLGNFLGAQGVTFAAPYRKKSSHECSKDEFGDILKIVIFLCVYWCFERSAGPIGRPNGCLETFLEHLVPHGGHFGDTCAAYLRHDGFK